MSSDALRLVGVEDDCDTAIGHLEWLFMVWEKDVAGVVGSNNGLRSNFPVDSGSRRCTEGVR